MEGEEWDKKRMKKTMEEGKEEFIELTMRLNDLMVDFCVRALKTFEAGKGEPLNPLQVNRVTLYELGAVRKQISDPEFIDLVVKKAELKYAETRGK